MINTVTNTINNTIIKTAQKILFYTLQQLKYLNESMLRGNVFLSQQMMEMNLTYFTNVTDFQKDTRVFLSV